MLKLARIHGPIPLLLGLLVRPAGVAAQPDPCCRAPEPGYSLTLCSPQAAQLVTRILPEGLAISFDAPPRESSSLLSSLQTAACDSNPAIGCSWGTPEGGVPPTNDLRLSGTYLGVRDQRIEVAILQIGTDADSGVVGTDVVRVAWSSLFRAQARAEFVLDASNADAKIPFVFVPSPGAPPDSSIVPGVRITFRRGSIVKRGWRALFDVEDFEGFHVWRWASDPNIEPRVVGTFSKLSERPRPDESWQDASADARRFEFLDRFVIDGNVYHYAVTTYDQGFDTVRGGTKGGVPIDSPLPVDGCPSQLRVDFLRPPPPTFEPVQAVPNPYRQVDCDPTDPISTCTVRFIRMPPRGTLLIFTLAGDLVQEFSHPEDAAAGDPPGTLRWNTTNAAGAEVASGVYIYKIVDLSSGQESFGRLAIIR